MPLLARFWSTDRSLTALLVFLLLVLFVVYPLGDLGLGGELLLSLFLSLVLISGVGAVAHSRVPRAIIGGLVVVNLSIRWMLYWRGGGELVVWDALLWLIYCGVLAVVVLLQVFREGPITANRIQGAIAVYLLLGFTWGFAYTLVATVRPDAFNVSPSLGLGSSEEQTSRFLYFSFVTLTTVGYGDITPVHPAARSLMMLEALTGQLFPAILLARLVSMELLHRQAGDSGRP